MGSSFRGSRFASRKMARPERFERPTPKFVVRRSYCFTEFRSLQTKKLSTVATLIKSYFEDAARGRHKPNGRPKRTSTLNMKREYFELLIKLRFGPLPLVDLNRHELQCFLDIGHTAPASAPLSQRHSPSLQLWHSARGGRKEPRAVYRAASFPFTRAGADRRRAACHLGGCERSGLSRRLDDVGCDGHRDLLCHGDAAARWRSLRAPCARDRPRGQAMGFPERGSRITGPTRCHYQISPSIF